MTHKPVLPALIREDRNVLEWTPRYYVCFEDLSPGRGNGGTHRLRGEGFAETSA